VGEQLRQGNRVACLTSRIVPHLTFAGHSKNSGYFLKLLYAYCSSLYGCELWDLWNGTIDNVCVAWRKALRRVWNLPFSTHSYFLFELSGTLPVIDAICKRVLSFISKCVNSDCDLMSFCARHIYGLYSLIWLYVVSARAQCSSV